MRLPDRFLFVSRVLAVLLLCAAPAAFAAGADAAGAASEAGAGADVAEADAAVAAADAGKGLPLVFRGSILAILEDNGMEGDPSPVLPSLGIALVLPLRALSGRIGFEPSIDAYWTYYGYSDVLDRAVPYAVENRSAQVYGTVIALPFFYTWNVAGRTTLRVFAGPAADLRLCLTADGLEGADKEDAAAETSDIVSYFWSEGRWFFPFAGVGADFLSTDDFTLGLELRVWVPAYRYWTGEELPAVEALRFSGSLRVALK